MFILAFVFTEHKGGNRLDIHQQMNYIMVLPCHRIPNSHYRAALEALSGEGIHDAVFNAKVMHMRTCIIFMWLFSLLNSKEHAHTPHPISLHLQYFKNKIEC